MYVGPIPDSLISWTWQQCFWVSHTVYIKENDSVFWNVSTDVLHVIISHTVTIWVFIALETSDLIQNNILGNSTDRLPTWEIDGLQLKTK